LAMEGPSRFPAEVFEAFEASFVDWDNEETEFVAVAGTAKGVAKDKERTSGAPTWPGGVCPPFAMAAVPPEVMGRAATGGA
jgi:hypothetical protein